MAQRSRELNSLLSRFSDGVLATSSRRRETIAGAAAIVAPLLCRKVAADHSPIAVEQAMREAVDVFSVMLRRRRRLHRSIVAEFEVRKQYDGLWSACTETTSTD